MYIVSLLLSIGFFSNCRELPVSHCLDGFGMPASSITFGLSASLNNVLTEASKMSTEKRIYGALVVDNGRVEIVEIVNDSIFVSIAYVLPILFNIWLLYIIGRAVERARNKRRNSQAINFFTSKVGRMLVFVYIGIAIVAWILSYICSLQCSSYGCLACGVLAALPSFPVGLALTAIFASAGLVAYILGLVINGFVIYFIGYGIERIIKRRKEKKLISESRDVEN